MQNSPGHHLPKFDTQKLEKFDVSFLAWQQQHLFLNQAILINRFTDIDELAFPSCLTMSYTMRRDQRLNAQFNDIVVVSALVSWNSSQPESLSREIDLHLGRIMILNARRSNSRRNLLALASSLIGSSNFQPLIMIACNTYWHCSWRPAANISLICKRQNAAVTVSWGA